MKKTTAFLLAWLVAIVASVGVASAQTSALPPADPSAPTYQYVEVYEMNMIAARTVGINYGPNPPKGHTMRLCDEQKNIIEFETAVGALNWLGARGWELVTCCTQETSNSKTVRYVLRRPVGKYPSSVLTSMIDEYLDTKK